MLPPPCPLSLPLRTKNKRPFPQTWLLFLALKRSYDRRMAFGLDWTLKQHHYFDIMFTSQPNLRGKEFFWYSMINAYLNMEIVVGDSIQDHLVPLRDITTNRDARRVAWSNSPTRRVRNVDWRHCRAHMERLKRLNISDPMGALLEVAIQMGMVRRGACAQEYPSMSMTRLAQASS